MRRGLHLLDTETGTASLVLAQEDVGAAIIGYAAHETGAVVGITDAAYRYGIGCNHLILLDPSIHLLLDLVPLSKLHLPFSDVIYGFIVMVH